MSEEDLKKLSCHFTWGLRKEDADLNFLEVKVCEILAVQCEYGGNLKHREFNFLAYIKHLQGLNDKALENLEQAEKEHSGNETNLIVTYGNLAWVHSIKGNVTKAQTYVEKVKDIFTAFPSPSPTDLLREVQSEKAWSFLKFSKKSYIRAKNIFFKAVQKDPDDQEWNTGYAFSLFRLEGLEVGEFRRVRFEESPAVVQLKKALKLDPDNAMIYVYLGLKCYKNTRNAEAWEYINKALKMAPDNLGVILRVAKFMKKEQCYDMALEVLLGMLRKAPVSSRLHHEIANNYRWKAMQMKDIHNPRLLNLCIYHLEKGASLNPGFIYPQLELALRYSEIKQSAKAEQKFKELLALPDLKPADLQAWHRMYGDFQLYRLNYESTAVEHYKQGLMLNRVSTEWNTCRNRLNKVLRRDRSDTYQIQKFFDSLKTENN